MLVDNQCVVGALFCVVLLCHAATGKGLPRRARWHRARTRGFASGTQLHPGVDIHFAPQPLSPRQGVFVDRAGAHPRPAALPGRVGETAYQVPPPSRASDAPPQRLLAIPGRIQVCPVSFAPSPARCQGARERRVAKGASEGVMVSRNRQHFVAHPVLPRGLPAGGSAHRPGSACSSLMVVHHSHQGNLRAVP